VNNVKRGADNVARETVVTLKCVHHPLNTYFGVFCFAIYVTITIYRFI
jgi:hypothetical protein